jgi:hypothetical protein
VFEQEAFSHSRNYPPTPGIGGSITLAMSAPRFAGAQSKRIVSTVFGVAELLKLGIKVSQATVGR